MGYLTEEKEWIGVRVARGMLVWIGVPMVIALAGMMVVDLEMMRREIADQRRVTNAVVERIDCLVQEAAWMSQDLQETKDEILLWNTKNNQEQPRKKGRKGK